MTKQTWGDVKKKKGKLSGMLTDDLARDIFNFQPGMSGRDSIGNPISKTMIVSDRGRGKTRIR